MTGKDNYGMIPRGNSGESDKNGTYFRNNTMTVRTPIMPAVPIRRLVLVNNLSMNPAFPFISLTSESTGSYIMMFLSSMMCPLSNDLSENR